MFAQALARRMAGAGIYYGWVVVAVSFSVSITTNGVMGMMGALMLPLEREFGWTSEQMSSALALRILLYGLMAPFAAALIERYGLKRVITAAVAINISALGLSTAMSSLWQAVVLFGVALGVSTGMTAVVMSAIVSTRWFTERRGLVVGILTASNATGQLIFLPVVAWLEAHYGWRAALTPAFVGLAFALIMVLLFLVERPSNIGLKPYGETGPVDAAPRAPPRVGSALTTLRDVSASPVFWVLAGTFFVCGLSTNGLVQTHFISLCADYGVPAVTAASMLALVGVCDFFGTIGSGWLSDRYDNRLLLCIYYGLRGISLLYLTTSSFSLYGLSLFSIFYGLDWVATVPPTVRLSASAFGRERAGVAFGWIFTAHMLGASFAAYAGGFARTEWSTYLPAFYLGGVACLAAAAIIWIIDRRPLPATAATPA